MTGVQGEQGQHHGDTSAPSCQDASEGAGWGETSGSSQVWQCCGAAPRPIWMAHQPARLTQLISFAVRDSCQMVLAFWSLPAQDRLNLVYCEQPWISLLLLWVTFSLLIKMFILLGWWYWCWPHQGCLHWERWEFEITSPTGFKLGVQGLHSKIQPEKHVQESL